MSVEILVPNLGESITEATIAKWLKNVGDSVAVDESLCELETEKVTMEVPSSVSGVIESITVAEGEDINVGALLCVVKEGAVAQSVSSDTASDVEVPSVNTSSAETKRPAVAPSAHMEAKKQGVNVYDAKPTGGLGNITKEDVKALKPSIPSTAPAQPTQPTVLPPRAEDPRGEERVPMSKLRKVISSRLKQAQNTAAMLSTFNEVDMTRLMEVRSQYKEKFEKQHGARLGFMSFFVKAAVQALNELPAVNAEIYGDDIIYKDYKDIGIAVGTPQGLVVPILRNAENMTVADIESTITDFGSRAKVGKLSMDEMTGGTFTITNGGVFGSLLSTPIINPPQSAILGLHKIEKRPVVVNDEVVVRQMMYLALSYDHRIIDGREAVTFLVRIKELLENPERLLLQI